jgi:hypothetical protein
MGTGCRDDEWRTGDEVLDNRERAVALAQEHMGAVELDDDERALEQIRHWNDAIDADDETDESSEDHR